MMNISTEKMLMEEIPKIRIALDKLLLVHEPVNKDIGRLKPGVLQLSNGRFMLNGRLIKKEDAYARR